MTLVLCVLGGMCVWATPTVKVVTLTDDLGSGWQDELVHYSLTFAAGELTGKAIARVEVNRADGLYVDGERPADQPAFQ